MAGCQRTLEANAVEALESGWTPVSTTPSAVRRPLLEGLPEEDSTRVMEPRRPLEEHLEDRFSGAAVPLEPAGLGELLRGEADHSLRYASAGLGRDGLGKRFHLVQGAEAELEEPSLLPLLEVAGEHPLDPFLEASCAPEESVRVLRQVFAPLQESHGALALRSLDRRRCLRPGRRLCDGGPGERLSRRWSEVFGAPSPGDQQRHGHERQAHECADGGENPSRARARSGPGIGVAPGGALMIGHRA